MPANKRIHPPTQYKMDFNPELFLLHEEQINAVEKAGEGNMNLVYRIKTSQRTFILKQAKPYVVKYPQIPAPVDRIFTEIAFYQEIEGNKNLQRWSPVIIQFIEKEFLMIMEDLGNASDYTIIYQNKRIKTDTLIELIDYLNQLHTIKPKNFPTNLGMKRLNHEHIFNIPFTEENGLNLETIQPGLQQLAHGIQQNTKLKAHVAKLGQRYLDTSKSLIHGDFYPGSWLRSQQGLKIIDPEFSFLGYAEFDLAVLAAHLKMAQIPTDFYFLIQKHYTNPVDIELIRQWEGVEIIRRLIGVAQLPVHLTLEEKSTLLNQASDQILNP